MSSYGVSKICFHPQVHLFDPGTRLLAGNNDGNLVNTIHRLFGKCSEKAFCMSLFFFSGRLEMLSFFILKKNVFLTSEDLVN